MKSSGFTIRKELKNSASDWDAVDQATQKNVMLTHVKDVREKIEVYSLTMDKIVNVSGEKKILFCFCCERDKVREKGEFLSK